MSVSDRQLANSISSSHQQFPLEQSRPKETYRQVYVGKTSLVKNYKRTIADPSGRSGAGIEGSNPAGARIFVSYECCTLSSRSPASCRSLLQMSPIYCAVSECDQEASITRRPWPLWAVAPWRKCTDDCTYFQCCSLSMSSPTQLFTVDNLFQRVNECRM
jgi:hypothetical protein